MLLFFSSNNFTEQKCLDAKCSCWKRQEAGEKSTRNVGVGEIGGESPAGVE